MAITEFLIEVVGAPGDERPARSSILLPT